MKLAMISQAQFGYHTISWNHCKYLCDSNEIIYVCWDHKKPKKTINNIEVKYIPRFNSKIKNNIQFLWFCWKYIQKSKPDLIYLKYFKGAGILRLLCPTKLFVLDVRTGDIRNLFIRSLFNDLILRLEALFFRNFTVISDSLRQKLFLPKSSHILPVGADPLCSSRFCVDNKFTLVYLGTLTGRKIEDTLYGLKLFINKFPNCEIEYLVIGTGWGNELESLKQLSLELGISNIVKFLGYLDHERISSYFEKALVGISYIPITKSFDVQPPTKTYEYLQSGLIVLATDTLENRKIINDRNGVLIKDTPNGFCEGLTRIFLNRDLYDSNSIIQNSQKYSWRIIVENLEVYLKAVAEKT